LKQCGCGVLGLVVYIWLLVTSISIGRDPQWSSDQHFAAWGVVVVLLVFPIALVVAAALTHRD